LEYVASVYATKVFVDDSISSYSVGYVAAGGGWSGAFIGGATVVIRRQSLNVIDVYVPGLTFTAIATLDLLLKFNPNIPTAHSFNGPQVMYTSKADAYTFLGKAQVVSSVNAPLSIRLKLCYNNFIYTFTAPSSYSFDPFIVSCNFSLPT